MTGQRHQASASARFQLRAAVVQLSGPVSAAIPGRPAARRTVASASPPAPRPSPRGAGPCRPHAATGSAQRHCAASASACLPLQPRLAPESSPALQSQAGRAGAGLATALCQTHSHAVLALASPKRSPLVSSPSGHPCTWTAAGSALHSGPARARGLREGPACRRPRSMSVCAAARRGRAPASRGSAPSSPPAAAPPSCARGRSGLSPRDRAELRVGLPAGPRLLGAPLRLEPGGRASWAGGPCRRHLLAAAFKSASSCTPNVPEMPTAT